MIEVLVFVSIVAAVAAIAKLTATRPQSPAEYAASDFGNF